MVNLNLGGALLIVLLIDGFLFMGQNVVTDINPASSIKFFQTSDSFIGKFDAGNNTLDTTDVSGKFIGANPSVSSESGDIFTDTFTKVKEWLFDSLGLNYVFAILGQPYYYCQALSLPAWFSFTVGAVWYGITLFLLIGFVAGRTS